MTIKTGQGSYIYCKERSLTIEMEIPQTMGRAWVGQRIGTLYTGWRIEERIWQWRFRSISSGKNKLKPPRMQEI
jgi:hypothetical protein